MQCASPITSCANLMIVQSQMNADSRTLDPATVDAIATWLAAP